MFRFGQLVSRLSGGQRLLGVGVLVAAIVGVTTLSESLVRSFRHSDDPTDPRNMVVMAGKVMGYGDDWEYFMDTAPDPSISCMGSYYLQRKDGSLADTNETQAFLATLEGAGLLHVTATSVGQKTTIMGSAIYDKKICHHWWDFS